MLRQLNEINPWLLAVLVVGFAEIYSHGADAALPQALGH